MYTADTEPSATESRIGTNLDSPKVMILCDDASMRSVLGDALGRRGMSVEAVRDGEELLRNLPRRRASGLVLVDAASRSVVDGTDGAAAALCRKLRRRTDVPVLVLGTAGCDEIDVVVSLEVGADGYVKRPFGERELVGRVRALLRRRAMNRRDGEGRALGFRGLAIDLRCRQVTVRGERVVLTAMEFELLALLAREPGRVYGRDEIMTHLRRGKFFGETRAVDVHVLHLRKKIECDPARPRYIRTVRGAGYRFVEG